MTREEELTAQGWQRQATYDEPRLSEMADLYRRIGLEVHLEPPHLEDAKGCIGCLMASPELYKTLYTRHRERLP